MWTLCIWTLILRNVYAAVFNIGTTATKGSLAYENVRYGVERWNSANSAHTEVSLNIIATELYFAGFEERRIKWQIRLTLTPDKRQPERTRGVDAIDIEHQRHFRAPSAKREKEELAQTGVCDVMQHSVVAVLIPTSEERLDEMLMKSMCHHFRIPCLTIKMGNPIEFASDFVTSIGPSRGLGAYATSEFVESLRWTSFLLAYQHESDLEELAPLIVDRRSPHHGGQRASIQLRRLPNNTDSYEPFLKYVRNSLRQTNIVIHSSNITTLYALLQQAKSINMTESPFSYIFTNTDLSLLEDFLNNVYGTFHCNITGLQLVKNDPMMKTTLALTAEAVWVIGAALHRMTELKVLPRPAALLCDARDSWADGTKMNDAIRRLRGRQQLTGDIHFDPSGEREDLVYYGIGRINSQFVKV
ncbi:hypothetical protein RB195_019971 [Necator americanus]|uniref:Receptor ligand binding region domain-containing protein n=2 Tax=Necator americanus TaxID=51031 RepID=A0ABR1CGL8_NECAM